MYTIASICLPGSYLHDFRLDQTLFKNSSTLFNEKKVLKNSILGQGFFFYIPKVMLLTVEHIQYDVAERKYQNLFVLEPNSNQLYWHFVFDIEKCFLDFKIDDFQTI